MEELQKQLLERDKIISELKEKTKTYITKLQAQHNDALLQQQEITKESQVVQEI